MDRTTLTRNLKPIQREGLIRIGTGEDRRERIVHLTAKGRRRLDRAVPLWKKAQSRVVRAVGRDGFERLLSDLGELVEEMSDRYNRHESDGMGFQSANKVNLKESKS